MSSSRSRQPRSAGKRIVDQGVQHALQAGKLPRAGNNKHLERAQGDGGLASPVQKDVRPDTSGRDDACDGSSGDGSQRAPLLHSNSTKSVGAGRKKGKRSGSPHPDLQGPVRRLPKKDPTGSRIAKRANRDSDSGERREIKAIPTSSGYCYLVKGIADAQEKNDESMFGLEFEVPASVKSEEPRECAKGEAGAGTEEVANLLVQLPLIPRRQEADGVGGHDVPQSSPSIPVHKFYSRKRGQTKQVGDAADLPNKRLRSDGDVLPTSSSGSGAVQREAPGHSAKDELQQCQEYPRDEPQLEAQTSAGQGGETGGVPVEASNQSIDDLLEDLLSSCNAGSSTQHGGGSSILDGGVGNNGGDIAGGSGGGHGSGAGSSEKEETDQGSGGKIRIGELQGYAGDETFKLMPHNDDGRGIRGGGGVFIQTESTPIETPEDGGSKDESKGNSSTEEPAEDTTFKPTSVSNANKPALASNPNTYHEKELTPLIRILGKPDCHCKKCKASTLMQVLVKDEYDNYVYLKGNCTAHSNTIRGNLFTIIRKLFDFQNQRMAVNHDNIPFESSDKHCVFTEAGWRNLNNEVESTLSMKYCTRDPTDIGPRVFRQALHVEPEMPLPLWHPLPLVKSLEELDKGMSLALYAPTFASWPQFENKLRCNELFYFFADKKNQKTLFVRNMLGLKRDLNDIIRDGNLRLYYDDSSDWIDKMRTQNPCVYLEMEMVLQYVHHENEWKYGWPVALEYFIQRMQVKLGYPLPLPLKLSKPGTSFEYNEKEDTWKKRMVNIALTPELNKIFKVYSSFDGSDLPSIPFFMIPHVFRVIVNHSYSTSRRSIPAFTLKQTPRRTAMLPFLDTIYKIFLQCKDKFDIMYGQIAKVPTKQQRFVWEFIRENGPTPTLKYNKFLDPIVPSIKDESDFPVQYEPDVERAKEWIPRFMKNTKERENYDKLHADGMFPEYPQNLIPTCTDNVMHIFSWAILFQRYCAMLRVHPTREDFHAFVVRWAAQRELTGEIKCFGKVRIGLLYYVLMLRYKHRDPIFALTVAKFQPNAQTTFGIEYLTSLYYFPFGTVEFIDEKEYLQQRLKVIRDNVIETCALTDNEDVTLPLGVFDQILHFFDNYAATEHTFGAHARSAMLGYKDHTTFEESEDLGQEWAFPERCRMDIEFTNKFPAKCYMSKYDRQSKNRDQTEIKPYILPVVLRQKADLNQHHGFGNWVMNNQLRCNTISRQLTGSTYELMVRSDFVNANNCHRLEQKRIEEERKKSKITMDTKMLDRVLELEKTLMEENMDQMRTEHMQQLASEYLTSDYHVDNEADDDFIEQPCSCGPSDDAMEVYDK